MIIITIKQDNLGLIHEKVMSYCISVLSVKINLTTNSSKSLSPSELLKCMHK